MSSNAVNETVEEIKEVPIEVVNLCHRHWTIPVLAEIHDAAAAGKPSLARFAWLQSRLDLPRQCLTPVLDHAIAHGWMRRNPGHGHPMRQEYFLTARGQELGPACSSLWQRICRMDNEHIMLRKWSLPLLIALSSTQRRQRKGLRFGELKGALPGLTDRGLILALKSLQELELLDRTVGEDWPGVPRYKLAIRARTLALAARQLARN